MLVHGRGDRLRRSDGEPAGWTAGVGQGQPENRPGEVGTLTRSPGAA